MIATILRDIDSTLIDNNLLHVLAWQCAFRRIVVTRDAQSIVLLYLTSNDYKIYAIAI